MAFIDFYHVSEILYKKNNISNVFVFFFFTIIFIGLNFEIIDLKTYVYIPTLILKLLNSFSGPIRTNDSLLYALPSISLLTVLLL